jgi:hypothetical protein
MRGGSEGSKKVQCEQAIRDFIPRIYMISVKDEHFIVFDPGYEHGNIYIYKQVEFAPIDRLRETFREAWDRRYLVYLFIKSKFVKEPNLQYELCSCR